MKKVLLAWMLLSSFAIIGCTTTTTETNLDTFAQCLTNAWVKMYGTNTCPYCMKQKAMFWDSFSKVDYVNCQENPTECTIQNIEWIPAWIFADGSKLQWLQELQTLADKTNCKLPGDNIWTGS